MQLTTYLKLIFLDNRAGFIPVFFCLTDETLHQEKCI